MIGHPENDSERFWHTPPNKPQPAPMVQVYITLPTNEDPWGTVETIPADQAAGRIRVGQELNQ